MENYRYMLMSPFGSCDIREIIGLSRNYWVGFGEASNRIIKLLFICSADGPRFGSWFFGRNCIHVEPYDSSGVTSIPLRDMPIERRTRPPSKSQKWSVLIRLR